MPVCKDPSLTFLNQFGYNVIKLPRTGIEPLHVVGRDETTQLLGPLSSVWKSTLPVPTPNAPRNAGDVNGQKTDKIDLKFSLKILENALKAFGATVPSLGFALNKARNISLRVHQRHLDDGRALRRRQLPRRRRSEHDEPGRAALLQRRRRGVPDRRRAEIGLREDDPQRRAMAPTSRSTCRRSRRRSERTCRSARPERATRRSSSRAPAPVTFGFAALEIDRVNNAWKVQGAKPSGALAFGTAGGGLADDSRPSPVLLRSGGMMRL